MWEDDTELVLTETEWEDVELDSSGSRCGKVKVFVNTVMNLHVCTVHR